LSLPTTLVSGLVVAGHGRHFIVETPQGQRLICHPRGKKSDAVVGDRVLWQASKDEGTIEKIEPRRNLFYRRDEIRTKSFAANLDQVLILIAAEPEFSEHQLTRALIAAQSEKIDVLIALNKSDLADPFARAWERLGPYRRMGYSVLPLALKSRDTGISSDTVALQERLKDKTTLVLGPSGAGKSTLINLLVPGSGVLTQEISTALNSGKHTTTSTTWYWVDTARRTALIDSPGFQEFGLQHIEPMHLASLMPDLKPWIPNCRFYNCTHRQEPGCGVLAALNQSGEVPAISPSRYRIYSELFEELSQKRY
jgi:ribosome biogenesis GTPase / thiamine phosphate phosphatase